MPLTDSEIQACGPIVAREILRHPLAPGLSASTRAAALRVAQGDDPYLMSDAQRRLLREAIAAIEEAEEVFMRGP